MLQRKVEPWLPVPGITPELSVDLNVPRRHLESHPIEPASTEQIEQVRRGTPLVLGRAWPFQSDGRIDWRLGPVLSQRLETITLHYHEWFEPLAASDDLLAHDMLRTVWADWLERCGLSQPGSRQLAWNAYAIATRAMVWLRCLAVLPENFWTDELPRGRVVDSLYQQARYLASHIEWDVRANHLLRDGVGLLWLARAFAGHPHASRWLQTATRIVETEAETQQADSGLHYEQSGHYHFEFLHDLDAAVTAGIDSIRRRLDEGIEASRMIRHPDGLCHGFSDGVVEWPDWLPDLSPPPDCLVGLAEHGVATLRRGDWTAFVKIGSPGPAEQPGHAHADGQSVEVSYRSRRLIVDPGTYHYDLSPRRARDRSTAAHNCVCVDGRNSSDVWHIFRMGRRSRRVGIEFEQCARGLSTSRVETAARTRATIHRFVRSRDDGELRIGDNVFASTTDRRPIAVAARFLIPSEWTVERLSDREFRLTAGDDRLRLTIHTAADLLITQTDATYSPRYLTDEPATEVRWLGCGERGDFHHQVELRFCPVAAPDERSRAD